MARVLITDGEQRSALAAARSLGRAGHSIYIASRGQSSLAGSSRYVRETAQVADALRSSREYAEQVIELVERWSIDLLLPVTESALLAILPERHRVAARLPFPTAEAFARLCDKEAVATEASQLGIRVPRTVVLRTRSDFARVGQDLEYPIVVKPHRSVTGRNGRRHKGAVFSVSDRDALQRAITNLPETVFPVLLQQRITGPGVGIFVLITGGQLVAAFAHKRIREKPPWGGVSVLRESIPLDPDLLQRSVDLLRRFDFEGAAMVEYKLDQQTNAPYIMEINGRFWGSLQLAIDAGVDFPALLANAALSGDVGTPQPYRHGVRSRWFWGDVDNLILQLRDAGNGRKATSVRLKACLDFVRAFGLHSQSEVLRLSDPMPAVRETLDWFAMLKSGRGHS